ncbi:MAG: hypothetical protein K9M54_04760 [Kiritimatiellales bacterium]|nr:hypothetical protein [Kiritimatiellales bacterium]
MKNSFWIQGASGPDSYSLFRGTFSLKKGCCVELRVTGASWYQAWLDGEPLLEGPHRYALDFPEYQVQRVELSAGRHVLAFHVHHIGVETRILKETPPFLWCRVFTGSEEVAVDWKTMALDSQTSKIRRINPQLGWIEWRDTRKEPAGWEQIGFDDSAWKVPRRDASALPEPTEAKLGTVGTFHHSLQAIAEGPLATTFGYPADEPAFIFFVRDRVCDEFPARGIWRRYDLGRVRLGRPSITLDVPSGTVVEMAYAESLTEGRVAPFINLSGGASCNLDRFIARGGTQTFAPLTPKGGRFLEVHVVNASEGVRFVDEAYLERCYHAPSEAVFVCDDALLDQIWRVGVETYRSCTEDALMDNATRERGQWVGDVASVGMEIASAAFHDLRLCRRALVQAAQCPRDDGLVAGMSPGGCVYLPTYAFQWPVAAMNYFRHTGDRSLLDELWPAAEANMQAIRAFLHEEGLHNVAGWNFVDWGYRAEDGPIDTACNLHFLWALRAMSAWAKQIGQGTESYNALESRISGILRDRIATRLAEGGWDAVGYHCVALAMILGLVDNESAGLDFLKQHIKSCFPNNPAAPRNDDPQAFNQQLITPYFAHYVLPLFIERGQMDFALEQYRTCWGWMLQGGRTTWVEVFDTRWSHSHQWAGCPTWQLTRYGLGLHPRQDLGLGTFDLRLRPGSLPAAKGRIPHPSGGWITISWNPEGETIRYRVESDQPLRLIRCNGEVSKFDMAFSLQLPASETGCILS